jgi:hypothetical protein
MNVDTGSSVRLSRIRGGERTWQIVVSAADDTIEGLRAASELARELDDDLAAIYDDGRREPSNEELADAAYELFAADHEWRTLPELASILAVHKSLIGAALELELLVELESRFVRLDDGSRVGRDRRARLWGTVEMLVALEADEAYREPPAA